MAFGKPMPGDPIRTAADITPEAGPLCPGCGEPMDYYGGTAGWIHCEFKLLVHNGGWFDDSGLHISDHRLAGPRQDGGRACVAGEVRERA